MGSSKSVREYVLERNGHTCKMCGTQDGDPDEYHPGQEVRLHVSRIISRKKLG